MVAGIQLNAHVDDKFIWKWSRNQQYLSSSAYQAFFLAQCFIHGTKELSKARAPPHCKFFMWTILHSRYWTTGRQHRHNMYDDDLCNLCSQDVETIKHLLLFGVYIREVWFRILQRGGFHNLTALHEDSVVD
jgi:hypothetical protein